MKKKLFVLLLSLLVVTAYVHAENGYDLWLRYKKIEDPTYLNLYRKSIAGIHINAISPTLLVAKKELEMGLSGLLGAPIKEVGAQTDNALIAGTPSSSPVIKSFLEKEKIKTGQEGFAIYSQTINNKKLILIAAETDLGVLYGVFHFLKLLQSHQSIQSLSTISIPKIQRRILNHWDNLNRSVERGYAGISIWNWHTLPDYIDKRYIDYARANASIGINGTVLTNVNASSLVLTDPYLEKVKALADVFRPYGIRVYLTAKFSAPVEIGRLKTADPLNPEVIEWWKHLCDKIYKMIPDFGGFLIKANSEGQPGPQGYGRTHADGANMFADILAPHGGIVMWRAFVYDARVQRRGEHFEEGKKDVAGESIASADRFKQAYLEFKPLDGKFKENVLIQVKNGPIDFQPREPFSPLFGAMPNTQLMAEFQITQEYLGQATHLVYQAPLYKECLDADTYAYGRGSTVAKITDGSLKKHKISAIAGVANIGNDINWTGHLFGQANWYAFGRLAWDHTLSSETIAEEWIRQTFGNNPKVLQPIQQIMMASREAAVNYMTPLGLHHIMGTGHHYGPAPWVENAGRADWNPVYYHKADKKGLGFDRTATGSDALSQYAPEVRKQWENMKTCNIEYILWFHHVPWNYTLSTGRSLWDELCFRYYSGADTVKWMQDIWTTVKAYIDEERYNHVRQLLNIQHKEAKWWRNACLLYFQTFSELPIPSHYEAPDKTLEYYKSLRFPHAPGINGNL